MQKVGLAQVAIFLPFTSYLKEEGSHLERHLATAGIDSRMLANAETLIPLHWACSFLQRVSHSEGIEGIGFKVGSKTPIASLGQLGSIVAQSLTLKDLLDRLIRWIPAFDSGARIWTEAGRHPNALKLCVSHHAGSGRAAADAFGLMILIDAVRLALGPKWKPERYWIDRAAGADLSTYEALSEGEAIREAESMAFEIPRHRLHEALRPQDRPPGEAGTTDVMAPPSDLLGSLSKTIQFTMGSRLPTIAEAADLTGMSSRTLQRRLLSSGLSYRDIIDRARHERATDLLAVESHQISDIARHLGYSNPANFTHAFHRWTGCSPSHFRKQACRAS